ncbi:hypothetical protein I7860_20245 [Pseudomonas tolaasii]|uniref:hypothetical protein n=1 Tax=Pseudomonas tolaasii TaxID=29442 RepID=UPI001C5A0E6D|nr:hypothetical protein [Pseudomonas tolaasii]MBW1249012.1 hypothetical protein [Pseudomonas tolaasii]
MQNISFKSILQAWCSAQSVCLFLFLVYLCALFIRVFKLDSTAVASWVQAIGAIISIWAAWGIASRQSRKAEAERARSDLVKCSALIGLLEHVKRVVEAKPRDGQGTISGHEVRLGIEKVLSMLDRIDVLTLPDPVLSVAVLETRHALEGLDLKIKDLIQYRMNAIMVLQYELSISRSCIGVVNEQLAHCKKLLDS